MKLLKRIYNIIFLPCENSVFLSYCALNLHRKGFKLLTRLFLNRLISKYGLHLNPNATIGKGLRFPHPHGIIIGQDVVIGDNCTIYHNVTLGDKHSFDNKVKYPKIGNNVIIYTGTTIIGDVKIHNNIVIGAHSLVLSDLVSPYCLYAGNPIRMIRDLSE